VVVQVYNPSTLETDTGVQSHSGLYREILSPNPEKKKNYAASIASFVRCQRYVSMFFLKAGIFKQ
jgi:hypothetical protein